VDLEPGRDAVTRDGLGEQLRREVLATTIMPARQAG